jgi:hypothetical protein
MNQDINIVVMELDIGEISNHNIFILCKRRFHIMLYEAAKVQSNLLVRNRFFNKNMERFTATSFISSFWFSGMSIPLN